MNAPPIRILIVDDSALYRQSIHNALREVEGASVVGAAGDGVEALSKIQELDPDLLTLDVRMPDMDGIELLRQIKRRNMRAKAIMVSSFTAEGAQVTTEALMEGAFDFILKPSSSDCAANRDQLRQALHRKIAAFQELATRKRTRNRRAVIERSVAADEVIESAPAPTSACRAVILGASTGGPESLKVVLSRLPAELPVPVFIVQHMPAKYTRSLAARLDDLCALQVVEGCDRMDAVPGVAIVAPGGKQMKLQLSGPMLQVRVNDDPPEMGVSPAVDYLVRSAAHTLDGNALAVIMTGMGKDGLAGCRELKQAGGWVFAQHQDDCIVYGMPKAIVENDLADRTLPLGKIAPAIVRHVKRSRRD